MKDIKKRISKILTEGLLDNKLEEAEEFIVDQFDKIDLGQEVESSPNKTRLVSLLNEEMRLLSERQKKLTKPEILNFIGEYFNLFLVHNGYTMTDLSNRSNIDDITLSSIFKNSLDITSIKPRCLASLSKFTELSLNAGKSLIEKSYLLFVLSPTGNQGMARYSPNHDFLERSKSMKDGVSELLLKAHKRKPLQAVPKEFKDKAKILSFLSEFEKAYLEE